MRGCLAGLLALAVLLSGCASIGPSRVSRDRVEYNRSITDSWKRQILLNIVKIRYVEPLFFMNVGEIVTSYSMETGGTLGVSQTLYSNPNNSASTLIELGGSAKYTDRPTITYRPLTGNDFFRGIMSPMPLRNVLASVESGASVEFLFRLGVRSINGLRNESLSAEGFKQAEEGFSRAVDLLNRLQARNAFHVVRVRTAVKERPNLFIKFSCDAKDKETKANIRDFQRVLGLNPAADKYLIGFGSMQVNDTTISLQTFTLAQVLSSIAGRMDMPDEDVASHRASPGGFADGGDGIFDRVMVRSSSAKPANAFAAIRYRGNWFWVDDGDLVAKRVFSFVMLAFTMMDKAEQNPTLQLTVPTQ